MRFGSGSALASGFIEHDGSGGGDVEGADAAGHGNVQQMIAGAANQIVEPCALAAEHDDEIAREVELVVRSRTCGWAARSRTCGWAARSGTGGLAALGNARILNSRINSGIQAPRVQADDPEVVFLQLLKGADEIDDTRDAKVLGGSGASFDGGRAQRSGAALGEEDAIDARAIGDAKKSAEVLRIFNAVDSKDEAGGGFGRRGFIGRGIRREKVLDGEEFLRANKRNDTLMARCIGGEGELLARLLADSNACIAALGDHSVKPVVVALAGDEHVVKAAAPGLESFRHRMQAVENFHGISLER